MREPIFEGNPVNYVPSHGLSEDPVETKPELSSKHAKPEPLPMFLVIWQLTYSIAQNQTYPHKHRSCKQPIQNSTVCSSCFKQWTILTISHFFLLSQLIVICSSARVDYIEMLSLQSPDPLIFYRLFLVCSNLD